MRHALAVLVSLAFAAGAHGQQLLLVTVEDGATGISLPGASVELLENGVVVETLSAGEDGRVLFASTRVGVELGLGNSTSSAAYPNPTAGIAYMDIGSSDARSIRIRIVDMLGRVVAENAEAVGSGRLLIGIDFAGLAKGVYFAQISDSRTVFETVPIVYVGEAAGAPSIRIARSAEAASVARKTGSERNTFEIRASVDGYHPKTVRLLTPVEFDVTLRLDRGEQVMQVNSAGMELVRIPAGAFRTPITWPVFWDRTVSLTNDFWIGRYEVTQAEFFAVTGARPSNFMGDDRRPVEQVSWLDAVTFLNALSHREGLTQCYAPGVDYQQAPYDCDGYRLPTEAEWERAARAGTETAYFFGETPDGIETYGWTSVNSEARTHPVGTRRSNAWGLYDTVGNVGELVNDLWADLDVGQFHPESYYVDPAGPPWSLRRIVKGGDWHSDSVLRYRAFAVRTWPNTDLHASVDTGFRVARIAGPGDIGKAGPSAPFDPVPPDGATGVDPNALLTWRATDVDGDTLAYEVRIWPASPDSAEIPIAGVMADARLGPVPLSFDTRYEWQVTAWDGHRVARGPAWVFTTATGPGVGASPTAQRVNSVGMQLIRVNAGTFTMGSWKNPTTDPDSPSNEIPPHSVTISQDFWLGKHEVTFGEYIAVTGRYPTPYTFDDTLPASGISWYDAVGFANALSLREGLEPCYADDGSVLGGDAQIVSCGGYRLPTEAEWEYAARAGSTTEFHWGDTPGDADRFAWFSIPWDGLLTEARPVGTREPNPWGFFDMAGNVAEWVQDAGRKYDFRAFVDPIGPVSDSDWRQARGGSYRDRVTFPLRTSARISYGSTSESRSRGFRIARGAIE